MTDQFDRFARQDELVPQSTFNDLQVSVIGVGRDRPSSLRPAGGSGGKQASAG